eukprot:SAG31_NODE_273_length_18667_cov_3.603619_14_plen_129_part_00
MQLVDAVWRRIGDAGMEERQNQNATRMIALLRDAYTTLRELPVKYEPSIGYGWHSSGRSSDNSSGGGSTDRAPRDKDPKGKGGGGKKPKGKGGGRRDKSGSRTRPSRAVFELANAPLDHFVAAVNLVV